MALGRIDHFTVLRALGHGGMSDVYLARDQRLDCEVALKVLREERAGDPTQRSRLLAEARAHRDEIQHELDELYHLLDQYVPGVP